MSGHTLKEGMVCLGAIHTSDSTKKGNKYTGQENTHPVVPIVSTGIVGFGVMFTFVSL